MNTPEYRIFHIYPMSRGKAFITNEKHCRKWSRSPEKAEIYQGDSAAISGLRQARRAHPGMTFQMERTDMPVLIRKKKRNRRK